MSLEARLIQLGADVDDAYDAARHEGEYVAAQALAEAGKAVERARLIVSAPRNASGEGLRFGGAR